MFDKTQEELLALGAEITTREIKQQPQIWQEALATYMEKEAKIQDFLSDIQAHHSRVKVIFTGAGTSAYVGETAVPQLNSSKTDGPWEFQAAPTTDIVVNPQAYFKADEPTLLVSFARSGNSPESVATVALAKQIVNDLYQITITCAKDGKLAVAAEGDDKNLLLLQPELSNDQGFAMTGSFSSMYLTTLLIFDNHRLEEKTAWVNQMIHLSQGIFQREAAIQALVDQEVERVIYLGSGPFFGLAHETQLKILELTAGRKATMYESVLGFRHGPKSLINENTAIIMYQSSSEYTHKYDLDLLEEVGHDHIAKLVVAVGQDVPQVDNVTFFGFEVDGQVPDGYLVFPYLLFGQIYALLSSVQVENKPDTPSPTGTVNRVVKGVTIYPYQAN